MIDKSAAILITEWALVPNGSNYMAPEQATQSLKGTVHNHPRKGNKAVRTSQVVETEGEICTHILWMCVPFGSHPGRVPQLDQTTRFRL